MKRVLVLGTGMVVRPLVDYFIDVCKYEVLVASRDDNHSGLIIAGRPLGKRVLWTAKPPYEELNRMVEGVDLVVSMIPPRMHPIVAEACISNRVNMVTTSYISPEMQALDEKAREAGIIILNEIGEDPGMDHMGVMELIHHAKADQGRILKLTSYGSGIPSFEHNRNPFGYKFSWSPRGLMRAAQTPAVFIREGKRVEVRGEDLFENFWLVDIPKLGTFETYPNRDSTQYLAHYGLDEDVDIYRGLLRFPGWCSTMHNLKALNLLEEEHSQSFEGVTYLQFLSSLVNHRSNKKSIHATVADYLNVNINSDLIKRFQWLGLFDDRQITISKGANVDVLVDLMQRRMSYEPHEKDMIIIHNELIVEFHNRIEKRMLTMRVEGRPYGHSAMSRAVSLPAAFASRNILEGTIRSKGVVMPTIEEIYKPVLIELAENGYLFEHKTEVL